jgi:hypothetical protein
LPLYITKSSAAHEQPQPVCPPQTTDSTQTQTHLTLRLISYSYAFHHSAYSISTPHRPPSPTTTLSHHHPSPRHPSLVTRLHSAFCTCILHCTLHSALRSAPCTSHRPSHRSAASILRCCWLPCALASASGSPPRLLLRSTPKYPPGRRSPTAAAQTCTRLHPPAPACIKSLSAIRCPS